MPQKSQPIPSQSLSEVKEQFKTWRKTRKSLRPIPAQLWAAAVNLTAKHSISQIAKELVLDYSTLKKRAAVKKKAGSALMSPADFIEVKLGKICGLYCQQICASRAQNLPPQLS